MKKLMKKLIDFLDRHQAEIALSLGIFLFIYFAFACKLIKYCFEKGW